MLARILKNDLDCPPQVGFRMKIQQQTTKKQAKASKLRFSGRSGIEVRAEIKIYLPRGEAREEIQV